jgi:hypothetical protein
MNLFVDTISELCNIIIFDNSRHIIDTLEYNIKWNESSLLIPKIDKIIKKNNLEYEDLSNIVVVNWPWSFTWIRTTVLVINTINYIIKWDITPIIATYQIFFSFVKSVVFDNMSFISIFFIFFLVYQVYFLKIHQQCLIFF